jgi:hypothetical protein
MSEQMISINVFLLEAENGEEEKRSPQAKKNEGESISTRTPPVRGKKKIKSSEKRHANYGSSDPFACEF